MRDNWQVPSLLHVFISDKMFFLTNESTQTFPHGHLTNPQTCPFSHKDLLLKVEHYFLRALSSLQPLPLVLNNQLGAFQGRPRPRHIAQWPTVLCLRLKPCKLPSSVLAHLCWVRVQAVSRQPCWWDFIRLVLLKFVGDTISETPLCSSGFYYTNLFSEVLKKFFWDYNMITVFFSFPSS